MEKYDEGDKSIFDHREVVRDLLIGFVYEDWVSKLGLIFKFSFLRTTYRRLAQKVAR